MHVSLSPEDSNLSYRVEKKTENKIRPIMVKFSKLSSRRNVYQAKTKLYSAEDLIKRRNLINVKDIEDFAKYSSATYIDQLKN